MVMLYENIFVYLKRKIINEILIYITDNEITISIFEVILKYRTAVFFYFFALVKMIKSDK